MSYTQLRTEQLRNGTIVVEKLATVSGATWQMTPDDTGVISGLAVPQNDNEAATKGYVDSLITDSVLKKPEAYATTADGKYPSTYQGGAVPAGATYIISDVTNGTTVGTKTVRVGDMLIAMKANPSATNDADWSIIERNEDLASEDAPGLIEIATQTETDAGTDDQRAVTPLKLTTYLSNKGYTTVIAGNGLVESTTGIDKTIDIVAADKSITVNTDSIQVQIGNTNGDSLEVSATGLELKQVVTGARTFQAGSGNTIVLDTDANNAQLTTDPDGTVDLAIATVKYVNDKITEATTEVFGEEPTITDGQATVTLAHTPKTGTLRVYLNGMRMSPNGDYTLSGTTITFGFNLTSEDRVIVDYKY